MKMWFVCPVEMKRCAWNGPNVPQTGSFVRCSSGQLASMHAAIYRIDWKNHRCVNAKDWLEERCIVKTYVVFQFLYIRWFYVNCVKEKYKHDFKTTTLVTIRRFWFMAVCTEGSCRWLKLVFTRRHRMTWNQYHTFLCWYFMDECIRLILVLFRFAIIFSLLIIIIKHSIRLFLKRKIMFLIFHVQASKLKRNYIFW